MSDTTEQWSNNHNCNNYYPSHTNSSTMMTYMGDPPPPLPPQQQQQQQRQSGYWEPTTPPRHSPRSCETALPAEQAAAAVAAAGDRKRDTSRHQPRPRMENRGGCSSGLFETHDTMTNHQAVLFQQPCGGAPSWGPQLFSPPCSPLQRPRRKKRRRVVFVSTVQIAPQASPLDQLWRMLHEDEIPHDHNLLANTAASTSTIEPLWNRHHHHHHHHTTSPPLHHWLEPLWYSAAQLDAFREDVRRQCRQWMRAHQEHYHHPTNHEQPTPSSCFSLCPQQQQQHARRGAFLPPPSHQHHRHNGAQPAAASPRDIFAVTTVAEAMITAPEDEEDYDDENNNNTTRRGLEFKLCQERQRRRYLTIRCVVRAQRELHHDVQRLAAVAIRCSQYASQLAVQEARSDFLCAYRPPQEPREQQGPCHTNQWSPPKQENNDDRKIAPTVSASANTTNVSSSSVTDTPCGCSKRRAMETEDPRQVPGGLTSGNTTSITRPDVASGENNHCMRRRLA